MSKQKMNMTIATLAIALFSLITSPAMAQDVTPATSQDATTELLTARRVKNWDWLDLFLTPTTNPKEPYAVSFGIGEKNRRAARSLKDTLSVVASDSFPIYLEGYNPFSMTVTTTTALSDDPADEALGKFIEAATSLGKTLSGASSEEKADAEKQAEEMKQEREKNINEIRGKISGADTFDEEFNMREILNLRGKGKLSAEEEVKLESLVDTARIARIERRNLERLEMQAAAAEKRRQDLLAVRSQELILWFLEYEQYSSCLGNGQDLWGMSVELDQLLFKKTGLKEVLDTHKGANSESEVLAAALALTEVSKGLEESVQQVERLSGKLRNIEPQIDSEEVGRDVCEIFLTFTKRSKIDFLSKAKDIVDKMANLKGSVDALVRNLNTIAAKYNQGDFYQLTEVEAAQGKIREVTVTIQAKSIDVKGDLDIETKDGKSVSRKIRVRDYRRLVPEAATGIVYANVDYPKFGTEEVDDPMNPGQKKTVIAAVTPDSQATEAALLLNLIFRTGERNIHPLLQLGLGTGPERPSFLIGGGIRFAKPQHLVIGVGALFPWFQEPKTLSIGDPVTGTAQLEEDLRFRLQHSPELYFGIQYSF